jgi:succinate dehydrogenase/fumarate reductase flavoprotein subunit
MRLAPEQLQRTLQEYNNLVEAGQPDAFGKQHYPGKVFMGAPIYVGTITPVVHYTMGGLAIDEVGRVLREGGGGEVVPGLYAAGEVSGGLHGRNRLGGNSLLECVVFGRLAGQQVAAQVAGTTA